jgi:VWFA-related protein
MGAIAAAIAAGAAVLAAQQGASDQQPIFRARTDLVSVYVVAVDAADQPVHGLKKENFTITDRKKAQSIDVFDEVVHEDTPSSPAFTLPPTLRHDVASNNVDLADRLVIVVADDLHIYKDRADRSKSILRMLVDKLGPKTPMALLYTSGRHSVPVTEDRSIILAAIDTLKGNRGMRRPADAVDNQMPRMANIDPGDIEGRRAAIGTAQSASMSDFFDNMAYYKTLQDASRLLTGDDGRRKTFVLLSEGIGKDMSWVPDLRSPTEAQGNLDPSPGAIPATAYHDYAILDMMRAMRRANVATYAIDPRGEVTNDNLMKECSPHLGNFGDMDPCSSGLTHMNSTLRLAQQGLEITADTSGGFAVTNTDDFEHGVDRIVSDLDNYYLLGFYPKDTNGNGFRALMVTVDQPGVLLRFRMGYEVGAAPAGPKTANPLTALAIGMAPKRDLPLRILASPFPGTSSKLSRVQATIEVSASRRELEDSDRRVSDSLKYLLLVADVKNGKAVKQLTNTANVTSSPMGADDPAVVKYQMPMSVELPPGRYQFRASASSTKLSRSGSVFLDVEVPDFSKDPVMLSGLEVGYADGPRVTQAKPAGAMQIVPFDPSLDREFHATDTVRVFFEIAHKGSTPPKATVELVDYTNRVVSSVTPPSTGTGVDRVDLKLPLKGLTPGAYRVRATATTGGTTATREVGIIVR